MRTFSCARARIPIADRVQPLALEAMRAAAVDTLRLYPDPEAQELREALAVHHGIKPEQVFVGNGR